MNEIKVGDLVMQIHDCCETRGGIGIPGVVDRIWESRMRCPCCMQERFTTVAHLDCDPPNQVADISWLRRIPPLSELESTEHKEEQPA